MRIADKKAKSQFLELKIFAFKLPCPRLFPSETTII